MIKHKGMLDLLVDLEKDCPPTKTLGIMALDDPSLYISSKEETLLMIPAADAIVENDHKPALFHAKVFIYTPAHFLKSVTLATWSMTRTSFHSLHYCLT